MTLQKLFNAFILFIYRKNIFPSRCIAINTWLAKQDTKFIECVRMLLETGDVYVNTENASLKFSYNDFFTIPPRTAMIFIYFNNIRETHYLISTIYSELKLHGMEYVSIKRRINEIIPQPKALTLCNIIMRYDSIVLSCGIKIFNK